MGALFMFGFITAIAIGGGVYFELQDRKEEKRRQAASRQAETIFSTTEGKQVVVNDNHYTLI